MNLDELKEGGIYKCVLSGKRTLIVMQTVGKEIPSEEEGGKPTVEEKQVVAGKVACVNPDNGDVKYFFNEIYDGQMEEITKK